MQKEKLKLRERRLSSKVAKETKKMEKKLGSNEGFFLR